MGCDPVPYPPKPPTTQAVGAALKREGFGRSQSSGVYHRTTGYAVRKCRTQPDAVDVRWWPDSREGAAPDAYTGLAVKRRRMLQRYADVLVRNGFLCRLSEKDDLLTVFGRRTNR